MGASLVHFQLERALNEYERARHNPYTPEEERNFPILKSREKHDKSAATEGKKDYEPH